MFLKGVLKGNSFNLRSLVNLNKKFIFTTVLLLNILSFQTSNAESCIPKDHVGTNISSSGLGNVVDTIVAIISGTLFGDIKGQNVSNIFNPSNTYIDYSNRDWESGLVYKTFVGITLDYRFQTLFYLCVILVVAYLGVSFAMGYSQLSTGELVTQFIKIAFVVFFTTPSGWDAYYELIVKNVLEASRYFNRAIIASMYNISIDSVTTPFQPINMVMDVVFHSQTWTKIGALFFANGFLFISLLFVVLGYVVATVIIILFKATVLYVGTIIMSSVLLAIGPIFAICLLFDKTKTYFSKWLTNLGGLFMQQYILFLGFFLFCVIIAAMVKGIFYFETCYSPVISLKLKVKMPKFIKDFVDVIIGIARFFVASIEKVVLPDYIVNLNVALFSSQVPTAPIFDLPSNIFSVACVFIVTMLFGKFIDMVSDIGGMIANADLKASEFSKDGMAALTKAQDKVTSTAKDASVGAMTGQQITGALRMAKEGQDMLKSKIKERELNGKTGIGTKALKVLSGALTPLSKAGEAYNSVVKSMPEIRKMRAIEYNQKIAQKTMEKEIGKIVGEGKAYSDISEVPEAEKVRIQAAVKESIKKDGTGAYDKNGNRTEVTEEIIEETLNDTITNSLVPAALLIGKEKTALRYKTGANLTFDKQSTTTGGKILSTIKRSRIVERLKRKLN